ncbi:hypothetical protein JKF63_02138 [Porcisia hertigi]|uniref:Uncharacterized protein n=1 Tax=Porcisia hertigi TaxID=2761500 RepID=A0A836IGU5_9TRYP|nr:hypothetical protein JKF63_02138 [Porcisia hertigi]
MSTFVPPPPPPGVVVPPVAVPAKTNAAGTAAANVVKPGGVKLDMSNLFAPPENVAKKSLPPWLRKKNAALPSGASPSPDKAPLPLTSATIMPTPAAGASSNSAHNTNVEAIDPSLSGMPSLQSVGNASGAGARNSLTTATTSALRTVPGAASPLPVSSVPQPPSANSVVGPGLSSATGTATSLPLSSTVPLAQTTPEAVAPPPASTSATTSAVAVPPPASIVNQFSHVAATAVPRETEQPTLPAASTAAIVTTADIVHEAMRELRPHLSPPTRTVVAPHVIFRGKEQQVVVSPLPPAPPRKGKKVSSVAVGSTGVWDNRYDLQPSPSFGAAPHYGSNPLATDATTLRARQQWTPNTVINSAKAKSNWRETYWKHVDVHRYVARRYFGVPPPLEQ